MTIRRTLVTVVSLLGCGLVLAAAPPALVNYQGVLRDSAHKPRNGLHNMVFQFYDAPGPGGDAIAVDTQPVWVQGGLFSVQLGTHLADGPGPGRYTSLTQVFAGFAQLYLEVQVEGETLTPRIPLASAGYALNASRLMGVEIASNGPRTLWVSPLGDDGNDGLNPITSAKRTIQGAVNAIPPVLTGDVTVNIASATYRERVAIAPHTRTGFHWIRLIGNPSSPGSLVIDGFGIPPDDTLDAGILVADLLVEISGITVQNFDSASGSDSGVQVRSNAYLELRNCRIVNNSVGEAGLLATHGGMIEVSECFISDNSSGVMSRDHGIIRIRDNVEISGNLNWGAQAAHGALVSFEPSVQNLCTITNNQMEAADHSTISGYSRCIVANSSCEPAAGDPTARCAP